jgi:hypothetical protein
MAGNAREWCWNRSGRERFILGGGWNDQALVFTEIYAQPPFDRSSTNGFRCVRYLEMDESLEVLKRSLDYEMRDYRKEKPASYETFLLYKRMYSYDKTDLHARIENVDENAEDWTKELVSFDAAYGDERERVLGHLFLPRSASPPYHVVLFFPGSFAVQKLSSETFETPQMRNIDFIIKSGRAVMYPIYKSTYERRDSLRSPRPDETNTYRDHVIMWVKDLSRSIDYLESRDDIDAAKSGANTKSKPTVGYIEFSRPPVSPGHLPFASPKRFPSVRDPFRRVVGPRS